MTGRTAEVTEIQGAILTVETPSGALNIDELELQRAKLAIVLIVEDDETGAKE